MAETARGQTLTRLLEGTGLAISSLRLGREQAGREQTRSPARNEIRVVGADQIVRVHRHADEPAAAPAATAPQTEEAPANSDTDRNAIPTLRTIVGAEEGWQDAGFFNVRVQRRGDGEQTRVVVRQIDRTGITESAEAARWMGPSVEAAAQWIESRTSALAVVAPVAAPRLVLPCALSITKAYAYQDPEEIDPRPLDAASMNAGVPIAADTPLTLAIAINASDSSPGSEAPPVKRCRVAVYVKTFPTGTQAEIGAHVLEINPAMDNWVARVPIKGLPVGRYRMTIVATLEAPYGGIAHREIPLVRVSQGAA